MVWAQDAAQPWHESSSTLTVSSPPTFRFSALQSAASRSALRCMLANSAWSRLAVPSRGAGQQRCLRGFLRRHLLPLLPAFGLVQQVSIALAPDLSKVERIDDLAQGGLLAPARHTDREHVQIVCRGSRGSLPPTYTSSVDQPAHLFADAFSSFGAGAPFLLKMACVTSARRLQARHCVPAGAKGLSKPRVSIAPPPCQSPCQCTERGCFSQIIVFAHVSRHRYAFQGSHWAMVAFPRVRVAFRVALCPTDLKI